MNENGKILAVVGVVLAVTGFIVNEIAMMYIQMDTNLPRPEPRSGPIIAGTAWLNLISVGMVFLFIAFILEVIDRFRRADITEIWDDEQE